MEHEAWPTPQTPAREPLPRVEDLPLAEQGYEQESVKAAFDSFYRHAAQLDAALRTLEAVDSFHRHASALRSDGWTQQSWPGSPPAYGYGSRGSREGVSPVVWRVAGEVAFLIAVAVAVGLASLSWWTIIGAVPRDDEAADEVEPEPEPESEDEPEPEPELPPAAAEEEEQQSEGK